MKLTSLVWILFIVIGCSSSPSKEQVKAFKQKLELEELKVVKDLGLSSSQKLPLKSGQWVTILTTMKDNKRNMALSTFKVIDVKGKTVTIEAETISTAMADKNILQYVIEDYPSANMLSMTKTELETLVDNMKIKKIVIKRGDEPAQDFPHEQLNEAKGLMKELFASGYRLGPPKKAICSSSYLKANSCYAFDFETNVFGKYIKGKSFAHSAVPVVGFIKSESEKTLTEVVNFGLNGAKSLIK